MEKTNAWVKVTSNEILKEKVWPPQEPEIQTGFIGYNLLLNNTLYICTGK